MVRLGLEPSSVWIWSSDLNWEVTIPDRPTPEAPLSPCRHAGLRSRTWGRKTAPVSRPDLTLVELSKAQTGKLRAGSSPVGPDWACAPCPTELPPSEFLQVAEATWLVLNVSSHSGAAVQAAGVTKIARSVIAPLAEHHVSVLMLSTYQTDFILVSFLQVLVRGRVGMGAWGPMCCAISCGPGARAGPVRGDPHAGPGVRHLSRGGRGACARCQG